MIFPGEATWNERVRLARLFHRLTQEKLAKLIGTSRRTYVRIETGQREPNDYEKSKIAQVLDEPVENLFRERRRK